MAKRTRNRMELRDQYEAAEAREKDRAKGEEEEGVEEAAEAAEDEAGEEAAPLKKAKKKAAPKAAKPKRTRTAKVVRQKVVWVVLDNSSKPIQTFPYPQKKEADDLAAKLAADKKSTYFVQPKKEAMEE
jgi:hypothetical protein